jgi:hypothetical protein
MGFWSPRRVEHPSWHPTNKPSLFPRVSSVPILLRYHLFPVLEDSHLSVICNLSARALTTPCGGTRVPCSHANFRPPHRKVERNSDANLVLTLVASNLAVWGSHLEVAPGDDHHLWALWRRVPVSSVNDQRCRLFTEISYTNRLTFPARLLPAQLPASWFLSRRRSAYRHQAKTATPRYSHSSMRPSHRGRRSSPTS